jgi:hypothetical protein
MLLDELPMEVVERANAIGFLHSIRKCHVLDRVGEC